MLVIAIARILILNGITLVVILMKANLVIAVVVEVVVFHAQMVLKCVMGLLVRAKAPHYPIHHVIPANN